jgi:hypothetical protein
LHENTQSQSHHHKAKNDNFSTSYFAGKPNNFGMTAFPPIEKAPDKLQMAERNSAIPVLYPIFSISREN